MTYRPARYFLVFVLFSTLSTLPSPVAAQARQPFREAWDAGTPRTVTGGLTITVVDDFAAGRSQLIHTVQDEWTGEVFQLRFEGQPPADARPGTRVQFSGRVDRSDLLVAGCCDDAASRVTLGEPAASLASGDQRTLVMIANFTDTAVSCSREALNNAMFTDPGGLSVNELYRASSLGRVWFSGQVVGPYALHASSTDACDISGWADAADALASASGVNVSAYPRKVYVMPLSTCPGAGLGTVGSVQSSRAWVFDCGTKGVLAHEIGHNLGMDHAATPAQEYGDGTDPMTVASWMLPGVNAPHRRAMGWLDAPDTPLVTSSGSYHVTPLGAAATVPVAPRALLIAKPDTGEHYYLSYRTPGGFDTYIDNSYYYRVSVHRYLSDGSLAKTYLLAGLRDGQSFVDAVNGITITAVSHDEAGATVSVELASSCVQGAPEMSLSPTAQSASPGATVNYAVAVTNRDSPGCPARGLVFTYAVPTGWTSLVSPATVTLAGGATAPLSLSVTSSPTAPAGTYTVSISANEVSGTIASSTAAYTVQTASDTVPPTAPVALAGTVNQKRKQVMLSWRAASDNVGIAGYRVLRNGIGVGTTATLGWTDQACSTGSTCVYSVVAYDAAGNVSAPSNSVTVTVSAGGKKG